MALYKYYLRKQRLALTCSVGSFIDIQALRSYLLMPVQSHHYGICFSPLTCSNMVWRWQSTPDCNEVQTSSKHRTHPLKTSKSANDTIYERNVVTGETKICATQKTWQVERKCKLAGAQTKVNSKNMRYLSTDRYFWNPLTYRKIVPSKLTRITENKSSLFHVFNLDRL